MLHDILQRYAMNFTNDGEDTLRKLANDEKNINCNDLYFCFRDYNFLEKFGTLYDLFLNLLTKAINTRKAKKEQNEMLKMIETLKNFILSQEKTIKKTTKGAKQKVKIKTEIKEDIKAHKSVLKNALQLNDKRTIMINAFVNKYIYPKNVYDQSKELEFEKSMPERTKMRRQKRNELNKVITEKDEIINKELFKNYFHEFESLSDMKKNCLKHRVHKMKD